MIKFIHSADWHLDSPFAALSPEEAARRREELRTLPDRLADYVNENRIGLVLLTGDLFDSKHVYPETLETLSAALGRMRAKVLITPGNHDCWGKLWDEREWSDNVYIFHRSGLTTLEVGDFAFHGGAFVTATQEENMLRGFRAAEDGKLHIGLFHGELTRQSPYHPIDPKAVEESGLAYLALGHIHKAGQLQLGNTLAAWPGCPEGRGFDETGEKGFYEGEIAADGGISIRFVPFARHKYEILAVDVTGRDVMEAAKAALGEENGDNYCRILLTGEAEGVDVQAVTKALQERAKTLEVRDETTLPRALWARRGEDSLTGAFLRRLYERMAQAKTKEERETVELAARFGLGALEGRDLG